MTAEIIWTLIQALLIPAMAGQLWLIYRLFEKLQVVTLSVTNLKGETMAAVAEAKKEAVAAVAKVKEEAAEALTAHRLHVAENYASTAYLKDVEERLVKQLTRIEDKIDTKLTAGSD